MYLKLIEKSYLKIKPNLISFVFYKNGFRESFPINDSAYEILRLCDGTHSFQEIVEQLKSIYDEETEIIQENVSEFLTPIIEEEFVEEISSRKFYQTTKGSAEIFYTDSLCWEITDYCPLKCRHCYLPSKNNTYVSKEDIDNVLKIIDTYGIHIIQLTGGEALTHPHFNYIVDELTKRCLVINVSTSGMHFNEELLTTLEKIKKIKGCVVKVSLDGNKETHTFIRNHSKSYEKTLQFLNELNQRNIPFQIASTLIDQSKEEIENLVYTAKKLGTELIEIGNILEQGNARKNQLKTNLTLDELNKLLKILKGKYEDKNFVVKIPENKPNEQNNCGAGYMILCFKENMDVTPCPMINFRLGNLREQSLEAIMQEYAHKFIKFHSPCEQFCKTCEKEDDCAGCTACGINNKEKVSTCNWYEKQKETFFPEEVMQPFTI
ncbi:MAG: PqqD family peptide modification chaperone [Lactobacillales bacterium]|nr:PqqD family peptide modification chaperone [Lactobacillales bacterium]